MLMYKTCISQTVSPLEVDCDISSNQHGAGRYSNTHSLLCAQRILSGVTWELLNAAILCSDHSHTRRLIRSYGHKIKNLVQTADDTHLK